MASETKWTKFVSKETKKKEKRKQNKQKKIRFHQDRINRAYKDARIAKVAAQIASVKALVTAWGSRPCDFGDWCSRSDCLFAHESGQERRGLKVIHRQTRSRKSFQPKCKQVPEMKNTEHWPSLS